MNDVMVTLNQWIESQSEDSLRRQIAFLAKVYHLSWHQAEELFQETVCALISSPVSNQLRTPGGWRGIIWKKLPWKRTDLIRRLTCQRELVRGVRNELASRGCTYDALTRSSRIDGCDLLDIVLRKLEPNQIDILIARCVEGHTYKVIAQLFGLSSPQQAERRFNAAVMEAKCIAADQQCSYAWKSNVA